MKQRNASNIVLPPIEPIEPNPTPIPEPDLPVAFLCSYDSLLEIEKILPGGYP